MSTLTKQKDEEEEDEEKEKYDEYISADNLNFDLSENEIEETKQIYTIQCSGLAHEEQQQDLWKTLAIARKNKLPLLTLVIDSFTRDRMDYFIAHRQGLALQQWSNGYPTLRLLSKKKRHQEMIKAAAQMFFHRYCSMIQLPVMEKYDDSIEAFADYICEATSLIHTIIDRDLISPPFQIDLLIIPKKVIDCSNINVADTESESENESENEDEDDSDDSDEFDRDDDEDSDNSDVDDETEKKDEYDPFFEITDIKNMLDSANVMYEQRTLKQGYRPRIFHGVFKDFKEKLKKNENIHYGFPHRERLCIILDRRKGVGANELFLYKPAILSEMPDCHLPEWYFESSIKSIIPGKQQNDTITAKTSANGYVFCLSFQIQQKDVIKCYLYTRSQMIRFLPDDIHNLFPSLFVIKNGDANDKFIQNEKKSRSKTKHIKLLDSQFAKFRLDAEKLTKQKKTISTITNI